MNFLNCALLSLPLLLRLERTALTRGAESTIGTNFCAIHLFSERSVGITTAAGPLAWSMMYPSQLTPTSVPPNCVGFMNTTSCAFECSESWSAISRSIGCVDDRQCPGFELPS